MLFVVMVFGDGLGGGIWGFIGLWKMCFIYIWDYFDLFAIIIGLYGCII